MKKAADALTPQFSMALEREDRIQVDRCNQISLPHREIRNSDLIGFGNGIFDVEVIGIERKDLCCCLSIEEEGIGIRWLSFRVLHPLQIDHVPFYPRECTLAY